MAKAAPNDMYANAPNLLGDDEVIVEPPDLLSNEWENLCLTVEEQEELKQKKLEEKQRKYDEEQKKKLDFSKDQGIKHSKEGDYQAAAESFEKSFKLAVDNNYVQLALGLYKQIYNNYILWDEENKKISKKNKNQNEANLADVRLKHIADYGVQLGDLLLKNHYYDIALKTYQDAVNMDKVFGNQSVEANRILRLERLALMYGYLKNYDQCLLILKKCIHRATMMGVNMGDNFKKSKLEHVIGLTANAITEYNFYCCLCLINIDIITNFGKKLNNILNDLKEFMDQIRKTPEHQFIEDILKALNKPDIKLFKKAQEDYKKNKGENKEDEVVYEIDDFTKAQSNVMVVDYYHGKPDLS